MLHRTLADVVVVAHLVFILFAVFGGLLILRWRWVAWVHVPALAWGAAVELLGWICPLTPLENWLRRSGGVGAYSGGFIEQYLLPVIYPAGLTRELQITLGLTLVVFNLVVYTLVWRRRRAAPLSS